MTQNKNYLLININVSNFQHELLVERVIYPLNTDKDGCCSCLKADYYKMGAANFIKHNNDGFKATCIMEKDIIVEPSLAIPQATQQGYIECPVGGVFDASYPDSKLRRGRVQNRGKILPTLTCNADNGLRYYEGYEPKDNPPFRIRKLTPRECFRLMGVVDENVDKIKDAGISNCQQYKMAGNSIVVDVLENIFRKLFVDKNCNEAQLSLF